MEKLTQFINTHGKVATITIAVFFSFILGFIALIGVWLLSSNFLIAFLTSAGVFTLTLVYAIKGATVPVNHRGLLILLGKRLKIEVTEGINGWLPKPFGDVDIHDMRKQEPVNLTFVDHKSIALSDGTNLDSAEISIIWRKMEGKLYNVTTIGGDIPTYIKELAEDRIRNAALALTAGFDKQVKKDQYRGLDALVLDQSIMRWQNIIKFGKQAVDKTTTPQTTTQMFSDAEIRAIGASGKTLPETGLIQVTEAVGIEIAHVTISSVKLPSNIRQAVDNLVLEPIEKKREKENMSALIDETNRINEVVKDAELAAMIAMLEKGTSGVKIHAVRGGKSTSEGDKIAAGLLNANNPPQ